MIGHFLVFLKTFKIKEGPLQNRNFVIFSCVFLSFWPQNQSERKHREKVDRAVRQF